MADQDRGPPGELAIDTFDLNCDLTIRPYRLAEQMKDKADRAIGCGDLKEVKKVIREGRLRWGGHTDVQVDISSLRVYEARLEAELGQAVAPVEMTSAVIGAGYMGARIAAELLIGGHEVYVHDIAGPETVEANIARVLEDAASSGYLGGLAQAHGARIAAMSRLRTAATVADAVSDARLICECVADNLTDKGQVYPEIVAACRPDAVFGSSSMNLPLDVIQELLVRPATTSSLNFQLPSDAISLVVVRSQPEAWRCRLIGLRFLAPILGISLVEVSHVSQDSRSSVKEVVDFMVDLGKTVIGRPKDAGREQPYIGLGARFSRHF